MNNTQLMAAPREREGVINIGTSYQCVIQNLIIVISYCVVHAIVARLRHAVLSRFYNYFSGQN